MVVYIAETRQAAAVDFRQGNVPPAQDNLGFIQQCQQSLPTGCTVKALRIDAAGYQTGIIKYCFALMRQLLPEELAQHRAITVRWRLYAIAAKVVKMGRQLFVKLKEKHRRLMEQVLLALKEFESLPI